jgi:hypothetical protein
MFALPLSFARKKRKPPEIAIAQLLLLFLAVGLPAWTGCAGIDDASPYPYRSAPITVSISPETATVEPGGYLQFSALFTGTSRTAVTWFASAGSISTNGLLHAPLSTSATKLTVTAISRANGLERVSAEVSVTAPPASGPTIGATVLSPGTVGINYSAHLSASGGQPPYQWSLVSGGLPLGIKLDPSSGVLSGIPTAVGPSSFVVGLTDKNGDTTQQSLNLSVAAGSAIAQCAMTLYSCARTDTAIIPVPSQLPFGGRVGANTVFYDPTFNPQYPVQYVRVTDANSVGPNNPMAVDAGASFNHWNSNDTMFWIENNGGESFIYSFNQSTLASTKLARGASTSAAWSQNNPNYWYSFTPNNVTGNPSGQLYRYDFTGCTGPCTPAGTLTYDFKANCGIDPEPFVNGTMYSAVGYGGPSGTTTNPDSVFAALFGPQDLANQVAAYNSVTGVCYYLNTQYGTLYSYTGTPSTVSGSATCTNGARTVSGTFGIAGSWVGLNIVMGGTTGYQVAAASSNSLTLSTGYAGATGSCSYSLMPGTYVGATTGPGSGYTFKVHGIRTDQSGTYAELASDTCVSGPCAVYTFWVIGTTTMLQATGTAGGHSVLTALTWSNNDGNGTVQAPISWISRTWANIGASTFPPIVELSSILATPDPLQDTHCGTKNDIYGYSSLPIICMTWSSDSGYGKFPYTMEVIGYPQQNPPNPVYRFGHTFNSNTSSGANNADLNNGSISSTGKYYLFTSDGLGTLGNANGTSSCSLTAGTCRTDVFILNLVPGPAN